MTFYQKTLNRLRKLVGVREHVYIRDPREIMEALAREDDRKAQLSAESKARSRAIYKRMWEIEDELLAKFPSAQLFVTLYWTRIEELYKEFVEKHPSVPRPPAPERSPS